MSKKKEYSGYKKPIPEHILLQKIQVQKQTDGFTETEIRYVIVDADTGEVFDDAQGYGYKTKQKAMAAFNYSKRSKEEFAKDKEVKKKVQEFLRANKDFATHLECIAFDELQCGGKLTAQMVKQIMQEENLNLPDGVSYKDLLKYL